MSAIASFIMLPETALGGLREAAVPKKRLFGAAQDNYHDYLQLNGREVADYKWSGYILATLLVYLQKQQIDLMKSDYDELAGFLTKARNATHFIFTSALKQAFLAKLGGPFSEQELCDYYNEFNGTQETEVGKPMLDGIEAFRRSLSALEPGSVIVFSVQ
jgi:hypothetical protein